MLSPVMRQQQQQQAAGRMSWSESISVPSTDDGGGGYSYRRSASVSGVKQPGRGLDVRRREGVRLGLSPSPSAFAESLLCYVGTDDGPSVCLSAACSVLYIAINPQCPTRSVA